VIFASPSHAYVRSNGVESAIGSDGFTTSWGFDANDAGQAVGFLTNTFPGYKDGDRGFLYNAGTLTVLPFLPGTGYTQANSINNAGTIVGVSAFKAYQTTIGAANLTPLPTPSGSDGSGEANVVNTVGEIAGWAGVAGVRTPARWSAGGATATLLPLPAGALSAEATLLNDSGVIAGQASFGGVVHHAFFYDAGGLPIDMGTLPGHITSEVYDINSSRQAVGGSRATGFATPFLYDNGTMVDLNTLLLPNSGWVLRSALAIDDAGVITGTGTFHFASSGFKLTPINVPEPASSIIFAVGILPALCRFSRGKATALPRSSA
jgi:probable HAF family extracellular repeat protein